MSRDLPARPSLEFLKKEAKNHLDQLRTSDPSAQLADAQHTLARDYGFASWPKLQARVVLYEQFSAALDANDVVRVRAMVQTQVLELLNSGTAASVAEAKSQLASVAGVRNWATIEARLRDMDRSEPISVPKSEVRQLCRAIEAQDVPRVKQLMTRRPALHRAPIGYGRNGPLTLVAECEIPPSPASLSLARWMVKNGSDVHQGGDGPLMRAALVGGRVQMMDVLVSLGADVNAKWDGWFPIIFSACEGVDVNGFSTNTCLPFSRAALVRS